MKNKTIFIFLVFILYMFYSSISFASNEIVGGVTGEAINGTSNATKNVVESASNISKNVTSGIGTATERAINGIANVTGDVANGMNNMVNDVSNNFDNDSLKGSITNEYNATQKNPTTANTFMGMDTSTWWLLIIALIVVLGVFLVWNYSNKATESDD